MIFTGRNEDITVSGFEQHVGGVHPGSIADCPKSVFGDSILLNGDIEEKCNGS